MCSNDIFGFIILGIFGVTMIAVTVVAIVHFIKMPDEEWGEGGPIQE